MRAMAMSSRLRMAPGPYTTAGRMYVALIAYAVLMAKVILATRLDNGIWIEGQGLARLAEISAMANHGVDVEGIPPLSAGYAVLVHIVASAIGTDALWPITVLQSAFFSFAVWYLAAALQRTRVAWATIPFATVALLNPALTLSTVALGGESVVASLLMLAVGQMIRDLAATPELRTPRRILLAALMLGAASFVAPAVALGSIILMFGWATGRGNHQQAAWLTAGTLVVLMALPLMLLLRNQIANEASAMPTTSNESISGLAGFDSDRCGLGTLDITSLGVPKFRCLKVWYDELSSAATERAAPNAIAFWSPWAGPLASSSLESNPWYSLHPARSFGDGRDRHTLLGGSTALMLNWMWMLGALFVLLAGFMALRSLGMLERRAVSGISWVIATTAIISALLGADAASRTPVLGLVLFMQIVGWRYLLTRGRPTSRDPFAPM